MLEVDQVTELKKLAGQGMAIRQIARQLNISKNTVRRYVRGDGVPGKYTLSEPRPRPVTGQQSKVVEAMLRAEREAATPRKQLLTAARIYRLLRSEHGYIGSESTIRKLVREVRGELRDPLSKAYVPLDYEPGFDAQVDFFEAVVDYSDTGRRKVFVLLVRPSFSGKVFVYVAPNQTQEALFEGLSRAFEFFGGVPRVLWFDNLTPAVRRVLCGRERVLQKDFEAFAAHYGFDAQFCRPACGNEKGGVENNVKFVRSELFTPIPKVMHRREMQGAAAAFMQREEHRTMRGRDRTIGELWQLEQPNLLPLPAAPFEIGRIKTCKVSNRSWIALGTNLYSVPCDLSGQEVQVRLGAEQITITSRRGVEAVHERQHGREQVNLKIEHYIPLLERKLRAVDRALPVKLWLNAHEPCWRKFLDEIRQLEGDFEGSKHFIDAVKMCGVHGTEVVTEALDKALRRGPASIGALRYELDIATAAAQPTPKLVEYAGPTTRQVTAADYDLLLETNHG